MEDVAPAGDESTCTGARGTIAMLMAARERSVEFQNRLGPRPGRHPPNARCEVRRAMGRQFSHGVVAAPAGTQTRRHGSPAVPGPADGAVVSRAQCGAQALPVRLFTRAH
jgi:hypothetical protein